jgi:hypothetical protein
MVAALEQKNSSLDAYAEPASAPGCADGQLGRSASCRRRRARNQQPLAFVISHLGTARSSVAQLALRPRPGALLAARTPAWRMARPERIRELVPAARSRA